MTVVAVIPARGGSKGIPLKNLQRVGGISLISRAITTCRGASTIDRVFVSTDDEQIKREALAFGAEIIDRPESIAGDTASSESALLHALDILGLQTGVLVFVQCTSPFIEPTSLNEAVSKVQGGTNDSVFSAVQTWDFLWSPGDAGLVGVNHDLRTRPRRQELPVSYRETGAFYAMDITGFKQSEHRFFGTVGAVEVDQRGAIDIDEPNDLELARALAPIFVNATIPNLAGVRALVMDFDGVHTDDGLLVNQYGDESVHVSRSDGFGLRQVKKIGLELLILSSEANPVVTARGEKLGIEVIQNTYEKLDELTRWLDERHVSLSETLYMGNDLNDIDCMNAVGFPVAILNSPQAVSASACYLTKRPGGSGAIREVTDLIIEARRS